MLYLVGNSAMVRPAEIALPICSPLIPPLSLAFDQALPQLRRKSTNPPPLVWLSSSSETSKCRSESFFVLRHLTVLGRLPSHGIAGIVGRNSSGFLWNCLRKSFSLRITNLLIEAVCLPLKGVRKSTKSLLPIFG